MSDTKVGVLIDEHAQRDAIHIAVAPVVAAHWLQPGAHVGFTSEGNTEVVGVCKDPIGVVDPFLGRAVNLGERFWLFLYPQTITSLRHNWTHPAFPVVSPDAAVAGSKAASEQWLRAFVARSDCPPYEELIGAAVSGGYDTGWGDGEYLHFDGTDAHGEIPPEFWDHVEIVTGRKPPNRAKYFSCSC